MAKPNIEDTSFVYDDKAQSLYEMMRNMGDNPFVSSDKRVQSVIDTIGSITTANSSGTTTASITSAASTVSSGTTLDFISEPSYGDLYYSSKRKKYMRYSKGEGWKTIDINEETDFTSELMKILQEEDDVFNPN